MTLAWAPDGSALATVGFGGTGWIYDPESLVERFKQTNRVVFTVATLEYLQKGGRIGKAQALAGSLLNVRPILTIRDGVVVPLGRVRGRQKALAWNSTIQAIADSVIAPLSLPRARR